MMQKNLYLQKMLLNGEQEKCQFQTLVYFLIFGRLHAIYFIYTCSPARPPAQSRCARGCRPPRPALPERPPGQPPPEAGSAGPGGGRRRRHSSESGKSSNYKKHGRISVHTF